MLGLLLATASGVHAAPNVTSTTQKGSLLLFPDIDVRGEKTTIVEIANDGNLPVDLKCVWIDGNNNRSEFVVPLTKNQPIWFDAKSGQGTFQVNAFPRTPANGFDNPCLGGADRNAYGAGLLVCFAVDAGSQNQIKWNHLSGSATIADTSEATAYQYTAYGFFVPTVLDQDAVGSPGTLMLNGVEYDSCPLYQIGQISPEGSQLPGDIVVLENRVAIAGCTLQLNQDWVPVYTKMHFDVWNAHEVKFSGAFDCASNWHETSLAELDAGDGMFLWASLGSTAARYRVQAISSAQCPGSQAMGLVAIQSTNLMVIPSGERVAVGTHLTAAGKSPGRFVWDPDDVVPEGGRR
jgi:hypothetical protein